MVIKKNQTRLAYHCCSVTQAFRIVHGLPVTSKQRGVRLPSEVKGLAFMGDKPLEPWPTGAWPYFDASHHKRLRKAVKNTHEKAPALDRLGQGRWKGSSGCYRSYAFSLLGRGGLITPGWTKGWKASAST